LDRGDELKSISDIEKNNGIHLRTFKGKTYIPYDKGEESDTDEAWLPCYYVPSRYFIDWSEKSVNRQKTLTIADRIRLYKENKRILPHYESTLAAVRRNTQYYFKYGITFSRTGVYAPTFRINSSSVYDVKGAQIFITESESILDYLGILNSKLMKYLFKCFVIHTVDNQPASFYDIPIINMEIIRCLSNWVEKIISKQNNDQSYDYMTNEQLEIDRLVYQMYNLNDEDIKEVEDWYFRRYPKLATVIEAKIKAKAAEPAV
ncbi:hypothetical protein KKC74_05395, partial [bacterium]|nr:hypothetical protein [bacterium]